MTERYKTIYKQGAMYQDNCPLILLASALLRDTTTGKMIVQLKLQNVGQQNIAAVFVDIGCRNAVNEDIGDQAFQYLDLQVEPQEVFGTQVAIELTDDTTRGFTVAVSRIAFENRQIWEDTSHSAFKPLTIGLNVSKQYPKEFSEQFRRDSGINAAEIYYPQQVSNLKICACGTVYDNGLPACPHCGYAFKQLQQMLDKAVLQEHFETYTENERTKAAQQQAQKKAKTKKIKKAVAILASTIGALFALAFLIIRVFIPAGHYKAGEALLVAGDYEGAAEAFAEAGDYKDAAERISATYYSQGETLLVANDYDGAVAAFGEAGDYKDAAERISATYYSQGEALAARLDYKGAVVAFTSAGNYRDAAERIPEMHYAQGEMLAASKDYKGAIEAFTSAGDYSNSADKIEECVLYPIKASTIGSVVRFGNYEQDNNVSNGKEYIEWLVLAKEGGKALLVSKYCLDCQPYNTERSYITWENCSMRVWLNGTFLNKAFSADEQKYIALATIANPDNQTTTINGNDTFDKVFLLSINEVISYFASDERQASSTVYAQAWGAHSTNSEKSSWWLRSPGTPSFFAAFVLFDGEVEIIGCPVELHVGVRPAFWIDLEP